MCPHLFRARICVCSRKAEAAVTEASLEDLHRSAATLQRIADVLGKPLSAFLDASAQNDCSKMVELLHIWDGLTGSDRANVLDYAKRVAGDARDLSAAAG